MLTLTVNVWHLNVEGHGKVPVNVCEPPKKDRSTKHVSVCVC